MFNKLKNIVIEFSALIIITVPSFLALLNNQYFSMHDDQHIARLYLLFEALKQGQWFPRWVDVLGFGYGYPLFNFYPPLIYYLSAGFHVLGLSLIWSIKAMLVTGFIIGAIGTYLLIKDFIGKLAGYVGATVYTYFFYHIINIYVRGAFAEFFSMAVLPFVFLGLRKLQKNQNISSALFFSISFALLLLTHPLIAFPSLIFLGIYFFFLFIFSKQKNKLILFTGIAGLLALGLSSFFWMPSMMERKYTLVDQILTKEKANYKDHYVYPQQFTYSPWGYGGSVKGTGDGMSFQLGKINILLLILSIITSIGYMIKSRNHKPLKDYVIYLFLFFTSVFLTTEYSSFIWDNIQFLSYIQFPWRMLTFTTLFISVAISYGFYFFQEILSYIKFMPKKYGQKIIFVLVLLTMGLVVYKYSKYAHPQRYITTNDMIRTTYPEIAWRISSTSFEFVPKTVATVKTKYNTTRLAINKNQLPKSTYEVLFGNAKIDVSYFSFSNKRFKINAKTPIILRLNNYNFPGWKAFINGEEVKINDDNKLKLITVWVPSGIHIVDFKFTDTLVRIFGNYTSIFTLFITLTLYVIYLVSRKKS